MSSLKLVNDKNPREIAVRILGRRKTAGDFTENLLETELAGARLGGPDRGLCQEIVYGCVRWQATLDWLIARKTDGREQKTSLQNLLRLGLYQIFWLDKIPPHAAVHETVELAKRLGFGPQAGFINAVLRGYLRETDATRGLVADLKASDPAIGFSHPRWLVEKWQKRFGADQTRQLLEWNNTTPKTYARVNALKTDPGKVIEKWRDENVDYDFVRRDWFDENLVFELKSHPPLASLESFRQGWFYIQDPSTLLAVRELEPKPGEAILDLCAAPGGKATFIAQLTDNAAKIVAADISEDRLALLKENFQRLGADAELVISDLRPDFNRPSPIGNRQFDKILIDAPCSNTGVLGRRVDLRWRITAEEIQRLRQAQQELLAAAARQLKPGGAIVYSTCSLEPEENAEVTAAFLAGNREFKLEQERVLLPFVDHVDGAYVARLRRMP